MIKTMKKRVLTCQKWKAKLNLLMSGLDIQQEKKTLFLEA